MNLSIKEMFRSSWAVFQKNVWTFVGATALIGAVSFVSDNISKNTDGVLEVVVGIVTAVLLWWLYLGFLRMTLAAHAGGQINFNFLFAEKWPALLQFIIASVVTGVIVGIGFILLIVPGVIAQVGLLFGAFFVVDKGMKGIDAVKASWNLTKGHKWDIFWAFIVLMLLNVAGALLFFVGLLVTVPMTILALTHMYKELEKHVSVAPVAPVTPTPAPQN